MPFLMSDFYEGKYGGQTMEANIAGKKAETAYREAQTGIIPLDRQLKELELKQGQQKLDMQKQMQDRLANLKVGESTAGTDLPSQIDQANQAYQQNMMLSQAAGASGMPEEALKYGTLAKQNQGEANTLLKQYNEEQASLLGVAKINPGSWMQVKEQYIQQYPKEAMEIAKMAQQQGIDMNNWNDPRVQAIVDQLILRAGGAGKMIDLAQKNADRDEKRINDEATNEARRIEAFARRTDAATARERLRNDQNRWRSENQRIVAEGREIKLQTEFGKDVADIEKSYSDKLNYLRQNRIPLEITPEKALIQEYQLLQDRNRKQLDLYPKYSSRGLIMDKSAKEKLEKQLTAANKFLSGEKETTPNTWEEAKKAGWK